jgi:excisionase family DNA binding protein
MASEETAPVLITSEEAARLLTISQRKLWELTKAGKVPCLRIGRVLRYDPRDLTQWVEDQKKWPTQWLEVSVAQRYCVTTVKDRWLSTRPRNLRKRAISANMTTRNGVSHLQQELT